LRSSSTLPFSVHMKPSLCVQHVQQTLYFWIVARFLHHFLSLYLHLLYITNHFFLHIHLFQIHRPHQISPLILSVFSSSTVTFDFCFLYKHINNMKNMSVHCLILHWNFLKFHRFFHTNIMTHFPKHPFQQRLQIHLRDLFWFHIR
jgi:hypothetical protein